MGAMALSPCSSSYRRFLLEINHRNWGSGKSHVDSELLMRRLWDKRPWMSLPDGKTTLSLCPRLHATGVYSGRSCDKR